MRRMKRKNIDSVIERLSVFNLGESFLRTLILLIAISLMVIAADAQQYPNNPIKGTTPAAIREAAANPSDVESINPFNGRLSVSVPMYQVGGRGEAGYTMLFNVFSFPWYNQIDIPDNQNPDVYNVVNNPGIPYYRGGPGYRPLTVYGKTTARDSGFFCQVDYAHWREWLTKLYIGLPDGGEIELRDTNTDGAPYLGYCWESYGINRGTTFASNDGSGFTFVSNSAIVDTNSNLPNGTEYPTYIPSVSGMLYRKNGVSYKIVNGGVEWMEDRNGNRTTFNSDGSITDANGRKVTFDGEIIQYHGYGGADRTAYPTYDVLGNVLRSGYSLQTQADLGIMPVNDLWNPVVVSGVVLPDGRKFQFKYDSRANVARLELPTGGAFEYDHSFSVLGGWSYTCSPTTVIRVTEKRSYDAQGNLETKTTYSADYGQLNVGDTNVTISTFDTGNHLLAKEKQYFYGSPVRGCASESYDAWNLGKKYKSEFFAANGTTVLRRIEYNWQQRANTTLGNEKDPRIVETMTTLPDTNLVAKVTSISPINGTIGFDQYNNQTDVWEYDFGSGAVGTFKRRKHTDYETSTNYTNRYLRDLPVGNWVSTDMAGNNKVSQTEILYDETSLTTRGSNVVGWVDPNTAYRGNVTTARTWRHYTGETDDWLESKSKYDVLGNIIETTDPKNHVTTLNYNDNYGSPDSNAQNNIAPTHLNGNPTYAFPTSTSNPLGWTVYNQYDYFTGQIVNTEDIRGIVSKTYYNDPLERPTQTVTAIGTSFERQTNNIYDDLHRRLETKGDLYTLNDNLLKYESFYDGLGRTVETVKYEADGGYIVTQTDPFSVVLDTDTSTYRVSSQATNPYRPLKGEQPEWTIGLVDSLGRPIKTIAPDGAAVKTEYNGNKATVSDQAGKKRRSVTNALGELTRVDEPNDAGQLDSGGVPVLSTNYQYDTLGNLTQVEQTGTTTQQCGGQTVPCTQIRTFEYDSLSRLKKVILPESGTTNYSHDKNGNIIQKTDARSITTVYTYDALNRMTSRDYSDSTPDVLYTYDNLTNSLGKPTKILNGTLSGGVISNPFSITEYTQFDVLGNVTKSKQTTEGVVYGSEMEYTYNLSGALTEEKYPSGRIVRNVFDNNGYLSMVRSKKNSNSGYWNYGQNISYTASGAVSSLQLGNGRWESTQFNSRLQPTQIALGTVKLTPQTTQLATSILKLNFTYNTPNTADNNGNVLSQTITVPSETRGTQTYDAFTATQTYTYDSLNRIKQATETISGQSGNRWQQIFNYDRYGNRTFDDLNTTETASFQKNCQNQYSQEIVCMNEVPLYNPVADTSNNRLNGYTFDNSGNTTNDADNRKFTYDAENKQIKVETVENGNVTGLLGEYWYDGDGKRVKKYSFEHNQWITTIFIYNAFGKLVAEYSTEVTSQPDAKVSYLTNDHLGSPRIITDQYGAVTARHDYQPFGEEIQRASYGGDTVRKQFTGYERDTETELDFAQARMYSYSYGRFSSPDPVLSSGEVDSPQTWNRYAYVLNNPLAYIDPTGMFLWSEELGGELEDEDIEQQRLQAIKNNNIKEAARLQIILDSRKAITDALREARSSTYMSAEIGTIQDAEALRAAIDAYGLPGVDNGVTVGVIDPRSRGYSTNIAGATQVEGGRVVVGFPDLYLTGPGRPLLYALVAHEGQHIIQAKRWLDNDPFSMCGDPYDPSEFEVEAEGYYVMATAVRGNKRDKNTGFSFPSVSSRTGVAVVYDPAWASQAYTVMKANIQGGINQHLRDLGSSTTNPAKWINPDITIK
jgi:RHS repeat-associated protein